MAHRRGATRPDEGKGLTQRAIWLMEVNAGVDRPRSGGEMGFEYVQERPFR